MQFLPISTVVKIFKSAFHLIDLLLWKVLYIWKVSIAPNCILIQLNSLDLLVTLNRNYFEDQNLCRLVASPRVYQLVFKVIAIMFYEHIKGIRCLSPVDEMTIIFHMSPGGLRTFACTNLLIKIKYIFLGQNEKRIKKIRFPVKDSNPRPTVNISRLKSAVNFKGFKNVYLFQLYLFLFYFKIILC